MGIGPTLDMIEHGGREVALRYHIFHRHYPPPPAFMLTLAEWAVAGSDWNEQCPEEYHDKVSDRRGRPLTRGALIEGLHLYPFIGEEK